MKKILVLMLVVMAVFAFSLTAFADEVIDLSQVDNLIIEGPVMQTRAAEVGYTTSISMGAFSHLYGSARDYKYTSYKCSIKPNSFDGITPMASDSPVKICVGTGNSLTFTAKKTGYIAFTTLNKVETVTLGNAGITSGVSFYFHTAGPYALRTASDGVSLTSY